MSQAALQPPNLRSIYHFKINKIIDHTVNIRELYCEVINFPTFNFKSGQFVMLHVPTENKPALRAYSIASADQDKKVIKLIFKFVENGIASRFVWDLKGSEILNMTGPFGKVFFQVPPSEQIVFLNTGSGISQHFSFLESNILKFPDLKYKLFFGVRNESDIFYENELQRLQNQIKNFEFKYVLSRPSATWQGQKGYVQDCLKNFNYKTVSTTFYMCGNGAMIKDVKKQLLEVDGIDKSRVWSEAFD